MNDAALGFAAFNDGRQINRADVRDGGHNFARLRRTLVGIQFVNIKSVRLPIFMQAKREVEIWLAFQPADMRGDFASFLMAIIAVKYTP